MTITIPRTDSASPQAIAELERRFGRLPQNYLHFLANHDGAKPERNILEGGWEVVKNSVSVRRFIKAVDIPEDADTTEFLDEGLVPIAEDDCGNLTCLGAGDHKVYFWEVGADEPAKVVANSFQEFLDRLVPAKPLDPDDSSARVISVWVDPDFKPEY